MSWPSVSTLQSSMALGTPVLDAPPPPPSTRSPSPASCELGKAGELCADPARAEGWDAAAAKSGKEVRIVDLPRKAESAVQGRFREGSGKVQGRFRYL